MRLLEKIIAEMHLSMKSGHKEKASALRTLVSKLKDQEIKLRKEISDEEIFKVIKTLIKQRKEAAEIYSNAGRLELAEKEKFEIDILVEYIPEPMSYYRWHNFNLSNRKFRLNILELIKWRNNLKKKEFFSLKNLLILNDHLIYLISLYFKNNNRKIKLLLFLKNINSLKKKILILIIFLIPKQIYNIIRS